MLSFVGSLTLHECTLNIKKMQYNYKKQSAENNDQRIMIHYEDGKWEYGKTGRWYKEKWWTEQSVFSHSQNENLQFISIHSAIRESLMFPHAQSGKYRRHFFMEYQ